MPILNPTTQSSLIPLVEKFNLIPHDKKADRISALQEILKEKINDKNWFINDLKPQLMEYGIKYSMIKVLLQEHKLEKDEDLNHNFKGP